MVHRLVLAMKGAAMGFADAIPGVSGGTMALILGIYTRFISALSALGPRMVPMLLKGAFWKSAIRQLLPGGEPETDPVGEMASHVAFLANLLVGIAAGLLVGVAILPVLMERHPQEMRAFFFGLVAASIVVPYAAMKAPRAHHAVPFIVVCIGTYLLMGIHQNISDFSRTTVVIGTADGAPAKERILLTPERLQVASSTGQTKLRRELRFEPLQDAVIAPGQREVAVPVICARAGVAGNAAAGQLVQVFDVNGKQLTVRKDLVVRQPAAATGGQDPRLWYVLLCGAIAICAMILPGISGSFLLLMLGLYEYVLGEVRQLVFKLDTGSLLPVVVFAVGVVGGILGFSRFLKWMLRHYHDATMAALSGLMLGSLRALWPFRTGMGHTAENTLPSALDGSVALTLAIAAVGVLIVTGLFRYGQKHATPTE